MRTFNPVRIPVVLGLCFVLSACPGGGSDEGGDATKSPDLPKPQTTKVVVNCGNANPEDIVMLTVGDSRQCEAICDVRSVDKNGNVSTAQRDCTNTATWATDCDGLTVTNGPDRRGLISAVSEDMCNVSARKDGVPSDPVRVDVVQAQVVCSFVYPRDTITDDQGEIIDPEPNADCSNLDGFDNDITVPLSVQIPYRAAVRLDNGEICYAPDTPAGQEACPEGLINFASSAPTIASFANASDGLARTNDVGETTISANNSITSNPAVLTVIDPQLDALCIEPGQPTVGCVDWGLETTDCSTTTANIPVNGTLQYRARAFFDIDDGDDQTGQKCDVTGNPFTDWSITGVGDEPTANPTVNNNDNKGLVSAGGVTTNGAEVTAEFDHDDNGDITDEETASALFNVVDNLVLGANSLIASTTQLDQADPVPTRAACVGSFNLVSGLIAPGGELAAEKGFFAVTRKCLSTDLDGNGNCADGSFDNTTIDDVTNAEAGNAQASEADGTVTWAVMPASFWDGSQCVAAEPSPPDDFDSPDAALLGDDDAEARYADGAAFTGAGGDSRVFVFDDMEDNGQVEAAGPLRLRTNCVEASYTATNTNGEPVTTSNGLTLIVIPITNDSLLTDPDAEDAVTLCSTLIPLFDAGGAELLAILGEILNPVLGGAGEGGLDQVVNDILAALEDGIEGAKKQGLDELTGPLTDILEEANAGAFLPLNCAINTILGAVLGQDPESLTGLEACQP